MKKLIASSLIFVCILALFGCNQQNIPSAFLFTKDSKLYVEGEPGVITSGFVNTTESKINNATEAIERAKLDCTIKWDNVKTYFDSNEKIWLVQFYTEGTVGGCQSVYLKDTGETVLIVYGE